MTSVSTTSGFPPVSLSFALELRATSLTCPARFAERCATIPFLRKESGRGARAGDEGVRFSSFSGHSSRPSDPEEGFQTVHSNRRAPYSARGGYGGGASGGAGGSAGYGSGGGGGYRHEPSYRSAPKPPPQRSGGYSGSAPLRSFGRPETVTTTTTTTTVSSPEAPIANVVTTVTTTTALAPLPEAGATPPSAAKAGTAAAPFVAFTSAAVRSGVSAVARVAQRAKGKLNRMGFGNYDATKASMREMLDSDEVGFLDDMLEFAFHKAASESLYCALFAKLLHELSAEFSHFRTSMQTLFDDYAGVFMEAVAVPETDTKAYKQWLDAQERKKFRRGYSQFVAELVKLGAANADAFGSLLRNSVAVLESSKDDAHKVQLCEEYGDCLATMCYAAPALLSSAPWAPELVRRLEALSSFALSARPAGFSSRGLFSLQNLVAFAKRGWR